MFSENGGCDTLDLGDSGNSAECLLELASDVLVGVVKDAYL